MASARTGIKHVMEKSNAKHVDINSFFLLTIKISPPPFPSLFFAPNIETRENGKGDAFFSIQFFTIHFFTAPINE